MFQNFNIHPSYVLFVNIDNWFDIFIEFINLIFQFVLFNVLVTNK